MVKAPIAGAVKSRLARDVGLGVATGFARHTAAALLQRLWTDRRWHTVIAVTPHAHMHGRFWPHRMARRSQGQGDLGARMQRLMEMAPRGPVAIIGSDIPGVTRRDIWAAFRLLGRNDAVFGPAADGGYWLVGLRRRPRSVRAFDGVRWSSRNALADTLVNLERHAVAFVTQHGDVDNGADLAARCGQTGRRVLPITAARMVVVTGSA